MTYPFARPGFTETSKDAAYLQHNLNPASTFQVDRDTPALPSHNAAMPHRWSFDDIKASTIEFLEGRENATTFTRWTDRLRTAGSAKVAEAAQLGKQHGGEYQELTDRKQKSQDEFTAARDSFLKSPNDASAQRAFIIQANSFHANVPDLGPHRGVNNPVNRYAHLRIEIPAKANQTYLDFTPMSQQVLAMTPTRVSEIATTASGNLLTTTGETFPMNRFKQADRNRIAAIQTKSIAKYDSSKKWP